MTPAGPVGTPRHGRLAAVLRVGFVSTLVLFLIGGFVLVGAQAVELALGNGTAVTRLGEEVGPPTFVTATICGLFAFAQEYLRQGTGPGAPTGIPRAGTPPGLPVHPGKEDDGGGGRPEAAA